MNQPDFTHIRADGKPGMVNVEKKQVSLRSATASGNIRLPSSWDQIFIDGDFQSKKGAVIQTAIIAGTQAVKRTAEWIPFCHPLPVEGIDFDYTLEGRSLHMECRVSCHYKTGVEMEALTGVSAALLTVYDMCKSAGQDMEIGEIKIVEKRGGKQDICSE